ncbi:MAG: hypothetical protein KGI30_09350 [Planctomycetota bacterium]|nr:hypothetical protein [Planctomycetota bacterium]
MTLTISQTIKMYAKKVGGNNSKDKRLLPLIEFVLPWSAYLCVSQKETGTFSRE